MSNNVINESFVSKNGKNQRTSIIARGFPSYILFSIFDYLHGPNQKYTNAPPNLIDSNFSLYLFPSKWTDKAIFAFEHNGLYGISIEVISANINHPRGTLHSTIALISEGICFGKKHYDFLVEAAQVLQDLKPRENESTEDFLNNFDFSTIFLPIYQRYNLSTPFDVFHPLYPFVKNNSASTFFAGHPESILTLWRFRMLKLKIVIACTDSVSIATDLSYFISAICLPFCNVDNGECAFHIDIIDNDKFTRKQSNDQKKWLVCAVTHQMMQRDYHGDVTVDKNGVLLINPNNDHKWLAKGGGRIISQLREIMASRRGDDELIRRMIDLTRDVMELGNKNAVVDEEIMNSIGLDKKNSSFLFLLYSTNHCPALIGTSSFCC